MAHNKSLKIHLKCVFEKCLSFSINYIYNAQWMFIQIFIVFILDELKKSSSLLPLLYIISRLKRKVDNNPILTRFSAQAKSEFRKWRHIVRKTPIWRSAPLPDIFDDVLNFRNYCEAFWILNMGVPKFKLNNGRNIVENAFSA